MSTPVHPCLCTTFIYSALRSVPPSSFLHPPSVPVIRARRTPLRRPPLHSIYIPLPSERLCTAPSSSYAATLILPPRVGLRRTTVHVMSSTFTPLTPDDDSAAFAPSTPPSTPSTVSGDACAPSRFEPPARSRPRPHPPQIHKRRGICAMTPRRRASRATMTTCFVYKLSTGLARDGCALAGTRMSTSSKVRTLSRSPQSGAYLPHEQCSRCFAPS